MLAFRVFINAVGPHFQANSSRFTVFKPPQDEPPPPTNLIEEFIRHEVPRLIRSQIEEKFSSTDNLEPTRETLSTSMMTFIERAIDTSILTFKTTAAEEILPQGNPNTTGLLVNLALVTPQNAEGRVPEQQENSADQDLRIPNPTSLPTLYDSLKPLTDMRPTSPKPTAGSNSTTSASNLFDVSAHEAVPAVYQDDGNDL